MEDRSRRRYSAAGTAERAQWVVPARVAAFGLVVVAVVAVVAGAAGLAAMSAKLAALASLVAVLGRLGEDQPPG